MHCIQQNQLPNHNSQLNSKIKLNTLEFIESCFSIQLNTDEQKIRFMNLIHLVVFLLANEYKLDISHFMKNIMPFNDDISEEEKQNSTRCLLSKLNIKPSKNHYFNNNGCITLSGDAEEIRIILFDRLKYKTPNKKSLTQEQIYSYFKNKKHDDYWVLSESCAIQNDTIILCNQDDKKINQFTIRTLNLQNPQFGQTVSIKADKIECKKQGIYVKNIIRKDNIYTGYINNVGQAHGSGKRDYDGAIIEGNWVCDEIIDEGKLQDRNGQKYKLTFRNNVINKIHEESRDIFMQTMLGHLMLKKDEQPQGVAQYYNSGLLFFQQSLQDWIKNLQQQKNINDNINIYIDLLEIINNMQDVLLNNKIPDILITAKLNIFFIPRIDKHAIILNINKNKNTLRVINSGDGIKYHKAHSHKEKKYLLVESYSLNQELISKLNNFLKQKCTVKNFYNFINKYFIKQEHDNILDYEYQAHQKGGNCTVRAFTAMIKYYLINAARENARNGREGVIWYNEFMMFMLDKYAEPKGTWALNIAKRQEKNQINGKIN